MFLILGRRSQMTESLEARTIEFMQSEQQGEDRLKIKWVTPHRTETITKEQTIISSESDEKKKVCVSEKYSNKG